MPNSLREHIFQSRINHKQDQRRAQRKKGQQRDLGWRFHRLREDYPQYPYDHDGKVWAIAHKKV